MSRVVRILPTVARCRYTFLSETGLKAEAYRGEEHDMNNRDRTDSGGSLERLREANRLRVVEALRLRGSASRSDLVELTGLSRTTITSLIADLHARGLITADNGGCEPSLRPRGRPPVLLRLAPSAGAALGVAFGHSHVHVAGADLASTVLAERRAEIDVDTSASAALDAAAELIDGVLADAGIGNEQVVAVGMGIPGPIALPGGRVRSSSILPGWEGLNPADALAARLHDVHVEALNDANLGALAESSLGAGKDITDVVYVKISSGIGAGLVLGGRLHYGVSGNAGELGHVQVREAGTACRCGNRGCLETTAAVPAVLAALRPAHGDRLDLNGMLELADRGDPATTRVINDAGRAVGRVLGDLCNAINPGAIVVGGDLSAAGSPLIDGIRDSVDRYAQPEAAAAVQVRRSALGARAEVLGALTLVIGDTRRMSSVGLASLAPRT
jgi:predicted NBD/HSP70 family sugar kinase